MTNLANKIEKMAGKLDGFTLDERGRIVDVPRGYAVGIAGFDSASELAAFVSRNPRYFAGYWKDGETGKSYFDAVSIFDDLNFSKNLARHFGEKAIYDFGSHREVRVS